MAHLALPCHWSEGELGGTPRSAPTPLINDGLIQRPRLSSLRSLGPLSSTYRASTTTLTNLLTKATNVPTCIHHPGAIQHRRWRGGGTKGWLMPLGIGRWLTDSHWPSPLPTSTPTPSTHYKRRYGDWWRSFPSSQFILKHSKLRRSSSRSSSRVVVEVGLE
jgi:hypothetical protein